MPVNQWLGRTENVDDRWSCVKEYRLASRTAYLGFAVILPVLGVGASIVCLWISTRSGHELPLWFGILWSMGMLWGSYRSVRIPHTIQVTDTDQIRFISLFSTVVIAASDVQRLKASGNFVELKHSQGKVLLLQLFTGFHNFVTELERSNPSVKVTGV